MFYSPHPDPTNTIFLKLNHVPLRRGAKISDQKGWNTKNMPPSGMKVLNPTDQQPNVT